MSTYTEKHITLFGRDTSAPRCQAQSKRSKQQCRKAAITGKKVCRMHGGASTCPRTELGRNRCAAAKTMHGWETRELRKKRAQKFREMRGLIDLLDG